MKGSNLFNELQRRSRTGQRHSISQLPRGYLSHMRPRAVGVSDSRIFNLEFSPDGEVVVVACEDRSISIRDGWNGFKIKDRTNAHSDCVNVVKFLNSNNFVTGSDDSTVALWDLRNMKENVKSFVGHSSWIKNCEVAGQTLLTFGLDGLVMSWDIAEFRPKSEIPHPHQNEILLQKLNLMRIGVTPDASKLVLATQNGFLILIHDLDLSTLANDMAGIDFPSLHDFFLHTQKFPQNFQFELKDEIEPMDSDVEFLPHFENEVNSKVDQNLRLAHCLTRNRNRIEFLPQLHLRTGVTMSIGFDMNSDYMLTRRYCQGAEETLAYDLRARKKDEQISKFNESYHNWLNLLMKENFEDWGEEDDSESSVESQPASKDEEVDISDPNEESADDDDNVPVLAKIPWGEIGFQIYPAAEAIPRKISKEYTKLIFNRQLVHLPEADFAEGFFKSPCFSSCARFICSPYHKGVRVFDVEKMKEGIPVSPMLWKPFVNTHQNNVLVAAYSPTLPLMASCGLDGVVCFYLPEL